MRGKRYLRLAVVDEAGHVSLAQDVGPFDQVDALMWLRELVQLAREHILGGESRTVVVQEVTSRRM